MYEFSNAITVATYGWRNVTMTTKYRNSRPEGCWSTDKFHHTVYTRHSQNSYLFFYYLFLNLPFRTLPAKSTFDVVDATEFRETGTPRLFHPRAKREGRSPASDCRVSPSDVASNLRDRRGCQWAACWRDVRARAMESTLAATRGWAARYTSFACVRIVRACVAAPAYLSECHVFRGGRTRSSVCLPPFFGICVCSVWLLRNRKFSCSYRTRWTKCMAIVRHRNGIRLCVMVMSVRLESDLMVQACSRKLVKSVKKISK